MVLGWLAILFTVVYFAFEWELYGTAFLTLIVGCIAAAILSYPILITLERPVRITPEQALRDYYGCAFAPFSPFSADVALAQYGGSHFNGLRVVRGFQGVLERPARAICVRVMPDHSPRWSLKSPISRPTKARARSASTPSSP